MLKSVLLEVVRFMESVVFTKVVDHFPHVCVVRNSRPELVPDIGKSKKFVSVFNRCRIRFLLLT